MDCGLMLRDVGVLVGGVQLVDVLSEDAEVVIKVDRCLIGCVLH